MSGSRNGTISLWKDKKIEKSRKIFDDWTLVLFKNDCIFAASKNKENKENIVELNLNLNVVKKFKGRTSSYNNEHNRPYTIDASENYVAVGYDSTKRGLYRTAFFDVHSRKYFDENGAYQKLMVSKFLY